MKPLPFLLLTVLAFNVSTAVQGVAASAESISAPPADDGFQSFLSSLENVVADTVSSKKGDKLEAQLQAMQIPDFQAWFVSTFGPDNGAKMAATYSETLTKWGGRLKDSFVSNAEPGGQVTASAAYGGPEAQSRPTAQQIDNAIRASLKHSATFYLVEYTGKSGKTGYPYAISFGYATLVNGSYRVIPENVMRALPGMPPVRIRQGGAITVKSLISRVQPVYPAEASKRRVSGNVRLHAVIGRDGSIQSVEVVSGDPLLVQAAVDAVRQWRYRPTTIQGEAVEIDTTIDVIFSRNR